MDLSNKSCDILLICGSLTVTTNTFNEQTKIGEIHEYIRREFNTNLPNPYRIVYYDTKTMSFVDLEDQLQHELNPFQLNTSTGVESTTYSSACTHLYIVSNTNLRTEVQNDQIVSNDIDADLSQHSISTNNEISQDLSTEYEDVLPMIPQNLSNTRLRFSLDVKSSQRDIYKSDQFNIRENKTNGRIARIQGFKTPQQKMLQILPKLKIPLSYFQPDITLVIAIVTEKIVDGMRIWYKYPHKGFLPERFKKDTESINPIVLNLTEENLATDGDYVLSLQMITKWNKSQKELQEFYRYDESKARLLHSAQHDTASPRLLCVLQRNGVNIWESFCLSDFIRSPKHSKERLSSVSQENIQLPVRKRLRIDE